MIIWSKTLKSKQCHCKKSAYMTLWWSHDVIICQTWSLSVNSVIILNFKLQSSDLKHDSFHLCLFDFPLIYQFYSVMTTLVRTTCWNPADLIIWKSFHHHFKRIWWGLLIEIEMQLFLLSLLKYSEMSSQMITFNHFRCHLSYFSSCK